MSAPAVCTALTPMVGPLRSVGLPTLRYLTTPTCEPPECTHRRPMACVCTLSRGANLVVVGEACELRAVFSAHVPLLELELGSSALVISIVRYEDIKARVQLE